MVDERTQIVIVDDDTDFLDAQKHILEARGYAVTCFVDPADALEAMTKHKPDLVITDLMMSALHTGFSFARALKERPTLCDVPVVIVTAISSQCGYDLRPNTPADLDDMHADAYFEKPIAVEALSAKIELLLLERRGRRQTGEDIEHE